MTLGDGRLHEQSPLIALEDLQRRGVSPECEGNKVRPIVAHFVILEIRVSVLLLGAAALPFDDLGAKRIGILTQQELSGPRIDRNFGARLTHA